MTISDRPFGGAKVALFLGRHLLVIRRDDRPDIPWPDHWDFPGGGREGDETPEACVLRETREETALILHETQLLWGQPFPGPQGIDWFFAAHLHGDAAAMVRLGDEGQDWALMTWEDYCDHDRAIPHFAQRVADYIRDSGVFS